MSRYDQPDAPDTDRYEDRPVDVADEPADGMSWADANALAFDLVREAAGFSSAIDPAEHAYHAAVDAFATLEVELAKASTTDRAIVLRRLCGTLFEQADRVAQASTSKLEDLAG